MFTVKTLRFFSYTRSHTRWDIYAAVMVTVNYHNCWDILCYVTSLLVCMPLFSAFRFTTAHLFFCGRFGNVCPLYTPIECEIWDDCMYFIILWSINGLRGYSKGHARVIVEEERHLSVANDHRNAEDQSFTVKSLQRFFKRCSWFLTEFISHQDTGDRATAKAVAKAVVWVTAIFNKQVALG